MNVNYLTVLELHMHLHSKTDNDTYSTATDNTWLTEANTDGLANYYLFITHGSVMT